MRHRNLCSIATLIALLPSSHCPARTPPPAPKRVTVRTSPKGGATEMVVGHLDAAGSSLFIASYQWSSRPIHDATVRAKARGLKVRVILDPAGERSPLAKELLAAGFTAGELRVDDRHAIFHHKLSLRDAEDPARAAHESGSFNYSRSAEEHNAEDAQVVEGFPEATSAYLADLETHWAHARPAKVK